MKRHHNTLRYATNIKQHSTLAFLFMMLFLFGTVVPGVQAKEYEIRDYSIDMQLTDEGHYLVSETMTFHFVDGSFSQAYRTIERRGFTSLHFVELRGVDEPIVSYDVADGNKLNVEWTYHETNEPRTFVLTYEARGGLLSRDGKNIIDWNAVGTDWDVPLNNVVVTIRLPEAVNDVEVSPDADRIDSAESNVVTLHRDMLAPNTPYRITASFPEIIPVEAKTSPPFGTWALVGIIVGIIIAVIDFVLLSPTKPTPAESGPDITQFTPAELAVITGAGAHRALSATLFALALKGRIRLTAQQKKLSLTGSNVSANVISDEYDNEQERVVLHGLQKHDKLNRFAQHHSYRSQIVRFARKSLNQRGIFSPEQLKAQRRALIVSLPPFALGVGGLIYAFVNEAPIILGIAIAAMLLGLSRMIRAATLVTLSSEGLFVKKTAENHLQRIFKQFESNVKRKPAQAVTDLFAHIPYLMLHKRFTAQHLQRLKKSLNDADKVEIPDWIETEKTGTDTLVHALTALEQLDVAMAAVIAAVVVTSPGSSGGTPGAGVGGGAGGGVGGGGGGAA